MGKQEDLALSEAIAQALLNLAPATQHRKRRAGMGCGNSSIYKLSLSAPWQVCRTWTFGATSYYSYQLDRIRAIYPHKDPIPVEQASRLFQKLGATGETPVLRESFVRAIRRI